MITASEVWMIIFIVIGLIAAIIISGISYSKGYDAGAEYKREDIEGILRKAKEDN